VFNILNFRINSQVHFSFGHNRTQNDELLFCGDIAMVNVYVFVFFPVLLHNFHI
jgi:hypothetical protein